MTPLALRRLLLGALMGAALAAVSACSSSPSVRTDTAKGRRAPTAAARVQKGLASYYHDSLHGRATASGEPYNRDALTAAHRNLPFGTTVVVRNLENGKSVRLRINDRGPFVDGRVIDVSRRAAELLDFVRQGLVRVEVEVED